MNDARDFAALVGRILLALMFVIAGIGKVGGFEDTTTLMETAGLPAVKVLLVLTILVEIGGGAAIIFGWKTRSSALIVFLFTALVTVVFHRFWSAPPDQAVAQQLMFMKNLSVMGGLLLLAALGPGRLALDDAPGWPSVR